MSGFSRLHPALQHHIVNSLGWRSLRPLQDAAVAPVLDGKHVLMLAPTAGGKTEAAIFPVFSRMLHEDWSGLSVLYICPIKALLNNLETRLGWYAEMLGRRVALWHGDVSQAERRRIVADPPDILLTTPESIEVMLSSSITDHRRLLAGVQCAIIDELHAFAGDDRGWHLLAVLERVSRVVGRDLQRLGLSATIGNPSELLDWLAGSSGAAREVVAPDMDGGSAAVRAEIELDYVGDMANAAKLISQLHHGEKRLVFCDSRSRVEQLSASLRTLGVNTYVSHSSVSLDERRRAEQAFTEERDAVIVATSTLELGIDVGDLDRVIQIDAPSSVASFLQRMGRTGRRTGSARNCLFLTTSENSLLQAAGLLDCWAGGFVEPVVPPVLPYHVLAQQILALCLQESGIGRASWRDWIGGMPAFAAMPAAVADSIVDSMLKAGFLFEDQGILGIGESGETRYGRRHFMELMAVFATDPMLTVRHGRTEIGMVEPLSLSFRSKEPPKLLLGGRSWVVTHVDWRTSVVYVEPTSGTGRSRWMGSGRPLRFEHCQAIRRVLAGTCAPLPLTKRAVAALESLREEMPWVEEGRTALVRQDDGTLRWWTFAGLRANLVLAAAVGGAVRSEVRPTNLYIRMEQGLGDAAVAAAIREAVARWGVAESAIPQIDIDDEAVEQLKFSECLPRGLVIEELRGRLADLRSAQTVAGEAVATVE